MKKRWILSDTDRLFFESDALVLYSIQYIISDKMVMATNGHDATKKEVVALWLDCDPGIQPIPCIRLSNINAQDTMSIPR